MQLIAKQSKLDNRELDQVHLNGNISEMEYANAKQRKGKYAAQLQPDELSQTANERAAAKLATMPFKFLPARLI